MAQTNGINTLGNLLGTSSVNGINGNDKAKTSAAPVSTSSAALDRTSLSAAGGFAAQGDSDVRTAKVAALQSAIANGTYNVSSGDVADKIIESLLG